MCQSRKCASVPAAEDVMLTLSAPVLRGFRAFTNSNWALMTTALEIRPERPRKARTRSCSFEQVCNCALLQTRHSRRYARPQNNDLPAVCHGQLSEARKYLFSEFIAVCPLAQRQSARFSDGSYSFAILTASFSETLHYMIRWTNPEITNHVSP